MGFPGAPSQYNVYGTTWLTPWLNITEHDAVSYTEEDMMPYITSRKKGFNDGKLILNLTILAQATNVSIDTAQESVGISRSETENSGNAATVNIPVGTYRSFNITYRDVTNAINQPWASNKSYTISGATISIESGAYDSTFNDVYFNNDTYHAWSYYEYSTTPGEIKWSTSTNS